VDVPYEPALALGLGAGRGVGRAPDAAAWAVWITGPPGSGKTTLAFEVAGRVSGVRVKVLELAEVRRFVLGGGAPSTPDNEEIIHRAVVYAAKRLTDAGVAVIVDATAPRRAWRELARELIARFGEVQLVCPREVSASRERAVRWSLLGCAQNPCGRTADESPEIVLDYEPALAPDAVIHTHVQNPWSATETILALIRRLASEVRATEVEWNRS